jgi:hypothetical protein
MKVFDLHLHSNFSDGTLSVEQLLKKAKNRSLEIVSITDHDTIDSQKDAVKLAKKHNINYIPGVEINVEFPTHMDLLGYGIDITSFELKEFLDFLTYKREARNKKMISLLQKKGFKINYDEVIEFSAGDIIGRPHIAKLLLKKGYGTSISEIINTYLTRGKECFLERFKFSPKDTIKMIKKQGGLAFLAHPFKINLKNYQLEILLEELKFYGLDGIEIFHYTHSPQYINYLLEIAEKKKLMISGGSDFHGLNKPYVTFGVSTEKKIGEKIIKNFYNLCV